MTLSSWILLLAVGCADKGAPTDTGLEAREEEDTDCQLAAIGPDYDTVFAVDMLQEVRLEIAPTDMEALNADPYTYVHGSFEHGGMRFDDVGLRLKGSSTFQDFSGKPSLKVKFDAFVDGQEYADMERLTLNNLTNDRASGREVIAYRIWNEAGMVAPHASFARLYINGEYYGLYAALEAMDDEFLKKRFPCAGGDLWEANDSADFTAAGIAHFELNTGEGLGLSLSQAAAVLEDPADDYFGVADDYVVMDQFLDFWAWSMATGNRDGYPYNLNDYFVYGDPEEGDRFVFSPWGLDETWDTGWYFQWGQGVVGFNCAASPECLALLEERTEAALQVYESLDVARMAQDAFDLTEAAMLEDPRMPWTPAEVVEARTRLVALVENWPTYVRTSMAAAR